MTAISPHFGPISLLNYVMYIETYLHDLGVDDIVCARPIWLKWQKRASSRLVHYPRHPARPVHIPQWTTQVMSRQGSEPESQIVLKRPPPGRQTHPTFDVQCDSRKHRLECPWLCRSTCFRPSAGSRITRPTG